MTQPTSINTELAAMRKIAGALESLDEPARERVVTWAYDRYHTVLDAVFAGDQLIRKVPT